MSQLFLDPLLHRTLAGVGTQKCSAAREGCIAGMMLRSDKPVGLAPLQAPFPRSCALSSFLPHSPHDVDALLHPLLLR
jgi:hypothetical protein